ncbi:MAG TPA: alpha/beta hydrolase, partial [Polyangiales bacterium]|nr:alpha/beta hydrolase [Polyangiales bacterium]
MHPLLYRSFIAYCIVSSIVRVSVRRLFRGPRDASWSLPFEIAVDVTRRFMEHGFGEARAGLPVSDAPTPRDLVTRSRVTLEHEDLAGLPAEVHTPKTWKIGDPTLLYWHGGGYISCSPATHRALVARIALHSGARCIVPCYAKAPVHPFPTALDSAVMCWQALLDSGVSPSTLFVGGDSAGGGLSLAMTLRLREAGKPLPRALILLSPWVDLTGSGDSVRRAELDILNGAMIEAGAALYAGGASLSHPLISPLHAVLEGLPPLLVQTGEHEVFFSENHAFVDRARAA